MRSVVLVLLLTCLLASTSALAAQPGGSPWMSLPTLKCTYEGLSSAGAYRNLWLCELSFKRLLYSAWEVRPNNLGEFSEIPGFAYAQQFTCNPLEPWRVDGSPRAGTIQNRILGEVSVTYGVVPGFTPSKNRPMDEVYCQSPPGTLDEVLLAQLASILNALSYFAQYDLGGGGSIFNPVTGRLGGGSSDAPSGDCTQCHGM